MFVSRLYLIRIPQQFQWEESDGSGILICKANTFAISTALDIFGIPAE
jgi:hypothetical protein